MAIAAKTGSVPALTYEQYLAEEEINLRYDIVDGVRILMTNPTLRHQRILRNLLLLLDPFERASGRGQTIPAPLDVLITRIPLRTRQPDVLFISYERLQRCRPASDPAALEVAPELVMEILSPSETLRSRGDKIVDYAAIGVAECWVISPDAGTIEVLEWREGRFETVAVFRQGDIVRSVSFTDLMVPLDAVFAE